VKFPKKNMKNLKRYLKSKVELSSQA